MILEVDADDYEVGRRRRGTSSSWTSQEQGRPILSKIRNFNNLALTSIGSLFFAPPQRQLKHPGQRSKRTSCDEFSGGFQTDVEEMVDSVDIPSETSLSDAQTPVSPPVSMYAQPYVGLEADSEEYLSSEKCLSSSFFFSDTEESRQICTLAESEAHTAKRLPKFRNFLAGTCRKSRRFNQGYNFDDEGEEFRTDESLQSACNPQPLAVSAPLSSAATFFDFLSSSSYASSLHSVDGPSYYEQFDGRLLTNDSSTDLEFFDLEPAIQFSPRHRDTSSALSDGSEDAITIPSRLGIREGKKPENFLADPKSDQGRDPNSATLADDPDEWYGMEYTLELSSRERQPSVSQSFSVGEHSRSRESWAALHQGRIHPFFEDEDYQQWKNWHRFLDRLDEKKKQKRGLEFKARSRDFGLFYAEQVHTLDFLYWQKEVYGAVARDVKERLQYLTEVYPDPFFPSKKYDLAWYLKRSRSIACLRELTP